MAIKFERSEPAKLSVPELETPLQNSINPSPVAVPSSDDVLDHVDETATNMLVPHENTVMDVNRAESIRRDLCMIPSVTSVGISAVDGVAEVVVRAVVAGIEHWLTTTFPVLTPFLGEVGDPSMAEPEVVGQPVKKSDDSE